MHYDSDDNNSLWLLNRIDKAIVDYDEAKLKALRLEQLQLLDAIDSLASIDFDYFGQFLNERYKE